MHAIQLDRWTERLVRGVSNELRAPLGTGANDERLLAELSQQVRGILEDEIGDRPLRDGPAGLPPGLVDEITLSVYLLLAARGSAAQISPELLLSLSRCLGRDLNLLNQEQTGKESLGG